MRKPKLLDLFCGAGGASVGYARAGFEVEEKYCEIAAKRLSQSVMRLDT